MKVVDVINSDMIEIQLDGDETTDDICRKAISAHKSKIFEEIQQPLYDMLWGQFLKIAETHRLELLDP